MKEKFVIIDGNSLINRAFYALPLLSNSKGEFSNGVYGFANILIKAILEIQPKYIAVALDYGRKTFRNEMYEKYKANRKETPAELKSQFGILKQMLKAMDVTFIEKENFEADDILGTLTKLFDTQNIIITGDRDALQLINSNTEVWLTKKGITEVKSINKDNFFEEYGLMPEQMLDLKALMGDSSDNIPGVMGVGEKTAMELMKTYKTLDGVFENVENVKGKLQEKLVLGREMAYLSRDLSTIKTDISLGASLKDFEYSFPFGKDVVDFFERYDFNSLLKRADLFQGIEVDETFEKYTANRVKIATLQDLKKQMEHAMKAERLNFDVGEEKFSFAYDKNCEFSVDFNASEFDKICEEILKENKAKNVQKTAKNEPKTGQKDAEIDQKSAKIASFLTVLTPIFEDFSIKKSLFDSKTTRHFLKNCADISLLGVDFDATLAYYLFVAGAGSANRENMLSHYNLSGEFRSLNLFYLKEFLEKDLREAGLEKLFASIELPLVNVLFDMENKGFKMDRKVLLDLKKRYESETDEMEKTIKRLAFTGNYSFLDEKESAEKYEENFNVNSPKQLAVLLFDKLKLTASNNKKRSTSSEILEEMFDLHPVVPAIIRYRKIKKILTTYVEPYEKLLSSGDMIHTCFNQTLTATGRLSSSEPNLQNIPVRDDEGKNLRKMFVTRYDGGALVSADYSQIELRLLAHMSGDEKLIDAFRHNIDIHSLTASEVFHVEIQNVTSNMRRMAKAVNFGIIYGISDFGLSQNIGSSRKQAKIFIEEYFKHYPKIKEYMDGNVRVAKERGFALSIFGRRRKINEIFSLNYNTRQFGERVAMNMPLQGSASDIIKLAMINVDKSLKEKGLKSSLILQVHDELIVDAPREEVGEVVKILKQEMENAVELNVPLTVDVNTGTSWFEC